MARSPQISELDILLALAEGKHVSEIAVELGVKHTYISHRLQTMRAEWNVTNNVQLMAEAYHRGVLVPRRRSAAA